MQPPELKPKLSKPARVLLRVGVAVGIALVLVALLFPEPRRSIVGRSLRFFLAHEPIGHQIPNDLAEDVRQRKQLSSLQEWAAKTIARYRDGQLSTNGKAAYWSRGSVGLAPEEVPGWLNEAWSGKPPEVSIRLGESGNPECITVGWYLYGLLVGPEDYVTSLQSWYVVQAKPGIYAYHDYK